MKKLTKVFSVFIAVLVFTSIALFTWASEKVNAAPAPALSQFEIVSIAKPGEFNGQGTYVPKSYASRVDFDSTVYVITKQMGYGIIRYNVDGKYADTREVKRVPIQGIDSNGARAVQGWIIVNAINGLSSGNHTINAACNSSVGTRIINDSVTITVK